MAVCRTLWSTISHLYSFHSPGSHLNAGRLWNGCTSNCLYHNHASDSQSFDGRLQDYHTSLSMAKSMEEFCIRFNNYTNHEYDNEVKMLIAFEYYVHHSRFNEIEAIRENIL